MSWRTNGVVVALRNLGRKTGANRLLVAARGSAEYEDRFQKAMLSEIRSGDCVWDVGANLGLYTVKFSEIVGAKGAVVAFEPSPTNFDRLKRAAGSLPNVALVPIAMGDHEGTVEFTQGRDRDGTTSRVVTDPTDRTGGSINVEVSRGDHCLTFQSVKPPDVIKIDTEGFELEVIRGLSQTLCRPNLRALFVEVHFGQLKDRGLAWAPAKIEVLLENTGFRCTWADASHIMARRAAR